MFVCLFAANVSLRRLSTVFCVCDQSNLLQTVNTLICFIIFLFNRSSIWQHYCAAYIAGHVIVTNQ